jgi:hypothetical protein
MIDYVRNRLYFSTICKFPGEHILPGLNGMSVYASCIGIDKKYIHIFKSLKIINSCIKLKLNKLHKLNINKINSEDYFSG